MGTSFVNKELDLAIGRIVSIVKGEQISEKYRGQAAVSMGSNNLNKSAIGLASFNVNDAINVNLKDISRTRSPSRYAIDLAKRILETPGKDSTVISEETAICKYIVDFIVTIDYIEKK
jgi:hypothetical protein